MFRNTASLPRSRWAFLLGFLLLPFLPSPSAAADKTLSSSALVIVYKNNTPFAQASGFLIDRNARLLITNFHVSNVNETVEVAFPAYEKGQLITNREYYRKAQRIFGRILEADPKRDLCVIQLNSVPVGATELRLAEASPALGDPTALVGNPGASPQLWATAAGQVVFVGQKQIKYENGQNVAAQIAFMTLDREFGKGSSGGPVVNKDGDLVGVIAGGPAPSAKQLFCIEVSELRSFLAGAHRNWASAQLHLGNPAQALIYYNQAVRFNPRDPLPLQERALLLGAQGKHADAATDWTTLLKLEPRSAAYRNRGSAYLQLAKYKEAIADCTEALKLDPKDMLAYNERGAAYSFLDRYAEAVADYTAVLKLDPKSSRAYRNRGSAYFHLGKYDEAVADCSEAIKLDPKYARAYLTRSKAYEKLNRAAEAKGDLAMAGQFDPSLK